MVGGSICCSNNALNMSFAEPDLTEKAVVETVKSAPEGSTSSFDQSSLERKLVRKLDLRIILPSFLIFMLCYLDRSNTVRAFNHIVHVYSLHHNPKSNARILNHATNDSLSDVINLRYI